MNDFLAMGGYGGYVWGSYAVFFIVLALEALAPRATRRRVLSELRGRLRRRGQRNEPSA
ncbi:MAG: heme exporter protein CcmD [Dokdonella sp.]|uniref:heme exporter protein CcmD n=1 Tax=Dokdonella sp. TaxID=2291710 RepID=UPI003F7D9A8A